MTVQSQELPLAQYDRGMRASMLGLVTNLVLALGKLLTGVLGHSHALTADATESLGDVFGSLIVWRGLKIGALGYYERYVIAFSGDGAPVKVASSAVDQYFGGVLLIGYVF